MINSTNPLWTAINKPTAQYSWLDEDAACEICVIGGGVTGALCAMRLAEAGIGTVLITASQIGAGATSSVMPCAEYDGGYSLQSLSRRAGEAAAVAMLGYGAESIGRLEQLAEETGNPFGFTRRDALIFTDDRAELSLINREYLTRRREGFDCGYISHNAASDIFPFEVAGAIVSKGLAAELDPYLLTHACVIRARDAGARVYENTAADEIETDGGIMIHTSTRHHIRAGRVIIAAGNGGASLLSGMAQQRTGFMVASGSARDISGWPGRCVIRTWSNPGITVASAPDGRVCAGGLTTAVIDDEGRLGGVLPAHKLCNKRFAELEAGARYLLPGLPDSPFAYATVTRYYETADRLPIIGELDSSPGCMIIMAGIAGGVLQSELCSRLIVDILSGDTEEAGLMFSPARRSLVR